MTHVDVRSRRFARVSPKELEILAGTRRTRSNHRQRDRRRLRSASESAREDVNGVACTPSWPRSATEARVAPREREGGVDAGRRVRCTGTSPLMNAPGMCEGFYVRRRRHRRRLPSVNPPLPLPAPPENRRHRHHHHHHHPCRSLLGSFLPTLPRSLSSPSPDRRVLHLASPLPRVLSSLSPSSYLSRPRWHIESSRVEPPFRAPPDRPTDTVQPVAPPATQRNQTCAASRVRRGGGGFAPYGGSRRRAPGAVPGFHLLLRACGPYSAPADWYAQLTRPYADPLLCLPCTCTRSLYFLAMSLYVLPRPSSSFRVPNPRRTNTQHSRPSSNFHPPLSPNLLFVHYLSPLRVHVRPPHPPSLSLSSCARSCSPSPSAFRAFSRSPPFGSRRLSPSNRVSRYPGTSRRRTRSRVSCTDHRERRQNPLTIYVFEFLVRPRPYKKCEG